jgi:hypothetical protein
MESVYVPASDAAAVYTYCFAWFAHSSLLTRDGLQEWTRNKGEVFASM